jgi:membrane protein DedA with SNARE-associated domain
VSDGISLAALLALYGFVTFGSIVPVVPTGAAVSGAAVLARADHPWELALVIAVGAAGAYTGDIVTYAVLRRAGEPLAQRIGWLQKDDPQAALRRIRENIEQREMRTLLVSRLVPGGRVPVLVAAALGGYPWLRYVSAAVFATLLWSVTYTLIGVVGDSLFVNSQVAVIVAVVAAVMVTIIAQAIRSRRR